MSISNKEHHRQYRHPYYLYAPNFTDLSSGIRVMHYLCHILNLHGYESYVTSSTTSPDLWTPFLTEAVVKRHFESSLKPVVIYPEITRGAPLGLGVPVRWLLAPPGKIAGHADFSNGEIMIGYREAFIEHPDTPLLTVPTTDPNLFSPGLPAAERKGKYFFHNRLLSKGGKLLPITADAVEISPRHPRSHEELSEIFKTAELLYCYEEGSITTEARMCGCPVVFLPNEHCLHSLPKSDFSNDGIAWGDSPEEIHRAQSSVQKIYPQVLAIYQRFATQLDAFIALSQKAAESASLDSCYGIKGRNNYGLPLKGQSSEILQFNTNNREINIEYQKWLAQRTFIETDTQFIVFPEYTFSESAKLHVIVRLPRGSEHLLADTLDSLDQQILSEWHLDIFTELPRPDGLDDIPNVEWHTLDTQDKIKDTIDFVVQAKRYDWIIEIPAGARFDILFLWRMTYEIRNTSDAKAFFFDDDCCNSDGDRFDPRFKPGVNIQALQSADLAGPICVRTDIWLSSGGASQPAASPWFSKLLQVADKSGWDSVKHIPDVLITYPNHFPTDTESCLFALSDSLKSKGIEGEIRNITSESWGIHYALSNPPAVTIAILTSGQLELVSRCLTSVLKSTNYPAYELLIVTNKFVSDPDFERWLIEIQSRPQSPKIRTVYVNSDANHATRCNAAIASSVNELVVLSRDETVFVQDIWLEELVRSLQQPDIVAASPLIHQAGDAKILASGKTLGLLGEYASPYSGKASLEEAGYLDCLQVTRDSIAIPSFCFLTRKEAYQDAGGMDEIELGGHFADVDLCLKFHKNNLRLIVHPRASVVYGGESSKYDLKQRMEEAVKKITAIETLRQSWGTDAVVDPYWNVNLSLADVVPRPETEYRALWQYLPSTKPRILTHPLGNGQGDFRVTSPLSAVRKAGLASECVWRQKVSGVARYFTAAELARLAPTTVIIQNYIHDTALAVLNDWKSLKNRPFVVYALDDLINDLDKTNPFRKFIPPNARSRLKYALSNCDRLVVSTDFLAETYRHFINDIKVVPNRLEKDIWLPLKSLKGTSKKPRIGWAGGSTHEGDLILLKEIIEQTREEADWVFFGMCPEEIRPLLAEYHDLVPFDQYPDYLASLNIDIAVAPLAKTPFNQGKSNLRLLEYGALGVPVVCTDIDPYQNSPACRVVNSAKAWVEALRERIYDVEAREAEGKAMRDWVLRSYILEDHSEEWLRAHLPD